MLWLVSSMEATQLFTAIRKKRDGSPKVPLPSSPQGTDFLLLGFSLEVPSPRAAKAVPCFEYMDL